MKTNNIAKMLELEIPTFKEILEEARGNEQLLEELLDKFRLWLKQQLHLPQGMHFEIPKNIFIIYIKYESRSYCV